MPDDLLVLLLLPLRLCEVLLLGAVVYHYVLVIASGIRSRPRSKSGEEERRFALVIPAQNEEAVIARTIGCARQLDYPSEKYDVFVIADHCIDQTAHLAQEMGASAYVRSEAPAGRKGYALSWAFRRLLVDGRQYDAFVVLDADSLIDSQFLNVVNAELDQGQGVLQGQRIVTNAKDSALAAIAAVDQRLNNRLRNQARTTLGWSCRLMGDAMCFARRVIERNPWDSDSLVEDREYGLHLLLNGIRTRYVAEAIVRQQAAVTWQSGQQQRLRWYRGAVEVQRRLAWQLIRQGLLNRSWAQLDGAIELLMPAYSTLTALTLLLVLIEWLLLSPPAGVFAVLMNASLFAWILYPVLGLLLDRAPVSLYMALLYGPVYLAWRLWLTVLTRILGKRIQWVRTQRREEIPGLGREDSV